MYWYSHRRAVIKSLIVYTVFIRKPESGGAPENKYSTKDEVESGSFTVTDVKHKSRSVYFYAVSKHRCEK